MRDIAREDLLVELLALKPQLEKQGVTGLALVGSRARQDNRVDSDIDLVIEVDNDSDFSLIDLSGVGLSVEDRLGISADIFMRRSLQPDIARSTKRDEVIVY